MERPGARPNWLKIHATAASHSPAVAPTPKSHSTAPSGARCHGPPGAIGLGGLGGLGGCRTAMTKLTESDHAEMLKLPSTHPGADHAAPCHPSPNESDMSRLHVVAAATLCCSWNGALPETTVGGESSHVSVHETSLGYESSLTTMSETTYAICEDEGSEGEAAEGEGDMGEADSPVSPPAPPKPAPPPPPASPAPSPPPPSASPPMVCAAASSKIDVNVLQRIDPNQPDVDVDDDVHQSAISTDFRASQDHKTPFNRVKNGGSSYSLAERASSWAHTFACQMCHTS